MAECPSPRQGELWARLDVDGDVELLVLDSLRGRDATLRILDFLFELGIGPEDARVCVCV